VSGVDRLTGSRTGGRRARTMAALLLALALVALSGCGVVSALLDTRQGLRDAGYQSVSVHFDFGGVGGRVTAHVAVAAPPTQADVRDVASVVWHQLHERFDTLDISVRGTGTGAGQVANQTYTFAELQAMFGARNPSWDRTTVKHSAEQLGFAVIAAIVVVAAAIVAGVLLTRRRRRRGIWGGGGPPWAGEGRAPLWPPPPGPPASPLWAPGRPAPPAEGSWEPVVGVPPSPAGSPAEGSWGSVVGVPPLGRPGGGGDAPSPAGPPAGGSWESGAHVVSPDGPWVANNRELPAHGPWASPPAVPRPDASWGPPPPPARPGEVSDLPADRGDGWGPPRLPD
jgi:hypothetical protein